MPYKDRQKQLEYFHWYNKNKRIRNKERERKLSKIWRMNNIERYRMLDRERKKDWRNCIVCNRRMFGQKIRKYCDKCRKEVSHKKFLGNQYWKNVDPKNRPRGKNHPNWRGGLTHWKKRIWDSPKYKRWRTAIFERDNYTCRECGQKGKRLEAHHLKSFTDLLRKHNITSKEEADKCDALWNIKLGQTLCFGCHQPTKNGQPRKRNK